MATRKLLTLSAAVSSLTVSSAAPPRAKAGAASATAHPQTACPADAAAESNGAGLGAAARTGLGPHHTASTTNVADAHTPPPILFILADDREP